MKIGIDARWVARPVGLGSLTRNLIQALARVDQYNQYVLYLSKESDRKFVPTNGMFSSRVIPGPYPLAEQFMGLVALQDNLEVFHCLLGTASISIPGKKLVVTIADAMFSMPSSLVPSRRNLYQKMGSMYRKLVIPGTYHKARQVVTISEKSKQDLVKYLGHNENIKVVYLAPGPEFKPQKVTQENVTRLGIPKRYILALVGTDPRKNTAGLLASYLDSGIDVPLVLVGKLDRDLVKNLKDNIFYIETPTTAALAKLYSQALLFIYPSLYEAFGLPILEAMACGCPVLALDVGSNDEISEDAAYLVRTNELARGIKKLVQDKKLRDSLAKAGIDRAREFNWDKTAREYVKIYEQVQA